MFFSCRLFVSAAFTLLRFNSNIAGVYGQVAPALAVGVLPSLFVHGDHFSVGQQIGYHTRDAISYRIANSASIQNTLQWILTPEGAAAYDAMLTTASDTYPQYIQELKGMSLGSGQSFQTLFALNIRAELGTFQKMAGGSSVAGVEQHKQHKQPQHQKHKQPQQEAEHCSDYLFIDTDAETGETTEILIGHNEDGGAEDRSISTLITVHIEGPDVQPEDAVRYTAFVYPGDLGSDAYFWNEHGLVGSFNGLYPTECLYGGLGRNLISRHLLSAKTLDEAVSRATRSNQATGHSSNLASLNEGRLVNVEQAPGINITDKSSLFVVTPITAGYGYNSTATCGALFRANSYLFLQGVETCESDSSAHRLARAAELPPVTNEEDICAVLGDTNDVEWPIYRTASQAAQDDGYTLSTAVFSLKYMYTPAGSTTTTTLEKSKGRNNKRGIRKPHGTATIYMSNPKTNAAVNLKFSSLTVQ